VAALGETLTEPDAAVPVVVTVTVADADFVASACEVAVTFTCGGFGTVAGAVYMPELVIVPPDAPPATLQVTAVFDAPVTVAVNCSVFPMPTLVAGGATETSTVGVLFDVAAQPDNKTDMQPRAIRTEQRM